MIRWDEYDCCRADRQALNMALLCKKNQQEARASPVAAPMPKSVSF